MGLMKRLNRASLDGRPATDSDPSEDPDVASSFLLLL